MIAKFLRFPWARAACVLGAMLAFMGLNSGEAYALPVFVALLFAGVALHGLAIWRDKS